MPGGIGGVKGSFQRDVEPLLLAARAAATAVGLSVSRFDRNSVPSGLSPVPHEALIDSEELRLVLPLIAVLALSAEALL